MVQTRLNQFIISSCHRSIKMSHDFVKKMKLEGGVGIGDISQQSHVFENDTINWFKERPIDKILEEGKTIRYRPREGKIL